MQWLKRFMGLTYRSKYGYVKSRRNDKLREATLRIYPNGVKVVEFEGNILEATALDSTDTVFRIDNEQNYYDLFEFFSIE